MDHQHILLGFLWLLHADAIEIPWIDNVSMVDVYKSNFTIQLNATSNQCLCSAMQKQSVAFNYFLANRSCHFFDRFPVTYRLEPMPGVRLYFPQRIFPNESRCCMHDWNQTAAKLTAAIKNETSIHSPRCLVIDNHGYLVTIEEFRLNIVRYDPQTLKLIDKTVISSIIMLNLAYHQERYFIALVDNTILVVDSNSLTRINTISSSEINGPRDIIFLYDGRIMVVSSVNNNRILFFQRSNTSSTEYTFFARENTPFTLPHGLWFVNNSCFYVTSWNEAAIYSYTSFNNTSWKVKLLVDGAAVDSSSFGSHLLIDKFERIWLVTYSNGIYVFDTEGRWLGQVTIASNGVIDALVTDKYIVFVSDKANGRIIRLDPQLTC
jgi:hypothetical protein